MKAAAVRPIRCSGNKGPQNPYNAFSNIDSPFPWSTAVSYELPFGKGKPFPANGAPMNYMAGGWVVNTVSTTQTGFPLSIFRRARTSIRGSAMRANGRTDGLVAGDEAASLEDRLNATSTPPLFRRLRRSRSAMWGARSACAVRGRARRHRPSVSQMAHASATAATRGRPGSRLRLVLIDLADGSQSDLTQIFDRPLRGREFFEEIIRDNLDLGRPGPGATTTTHL